MEQDAEFSPVGPIKWGHFCFHPMEEMPGFLDPCVFSTGDVIVYKDPVYRLHNPIL